MADGRGRAIVWGRMPDLPEPPTCAACGEVIGVYEPMVADRGDGTVVEASIAAEPALEERGWTRYHRDCHRRSLAA